MRTLKFRAWDTINKKMLEPLSGIMWNCPVVPANYIEGLFDGAIPANYSYLDTISEIMLKAENCIIMQYIELNDLMSKEIYEGDIVRINHPSDMTGDFTNAVGEVFWWDGQGAFYHGNNNGRPPKRMWQYVEVIGNVCENPELIPEEEEVHDE